MNRVMAKLIQTKLTKVISELVLLIKTYRKNINVNTPSKYDSKLITGLLFICYINILKNINCLLKEKNPIMVPMLSRSCIDILVLLRLTSQNLNSFLCHEKKLLQDRKNTIKKELKNFLLGKKLEERSREELISIAKAILLIEYLADEIKELHVFNSKKLKEFEKRKLAKIENFVELYYHELSGYIHFGLLNLYELNLKNKKGKWSVDMYKTIDISTIAFSIYTSIQVLKLLLAEFVKIFGFTNTFDFNKLYKTIKLCETTCVKYFYKKV